jgi:hypothetical protein
MSKAVTKQALRQILEARFEEKQFTSATASNTALNPSGDLIYLNPIAQGDDISARNGDTIQAKHLRFQLTAFSVTGTQGNTVRLIIFSDTMASGGFLSVSEYLQNTSYMSPVSAINMQRKRFHTYYDHVDAVVATSSKQEINFVVDIPLNRKIFFNGTAATSGSVGKNSMYALVISSNAQGLYNNLWGLRFQDN